MIKKLISTFLIISLFASNVPVFAEETINIINDIELYSDDEDLLFTTFDGTYAEDTLFEEAEDIEISFNYDTEVEIEMPISQAEEINENDITAASYSDIIPNVKMGDSYSLSNQTDKINFAGNNTSAEYIDPMTGNLIITETDLVLSGVDGLDLRLERYYSLAQADYYTKSYNIIPQSKSYTLEEDAYVVTETITDEETYEEHKYYYAYYREEDSELRKKEINNRNQYDDGYIYEAVVNQRSAGETITLDYYYISDIGTTNYAIARNNLGAGWSWCFPSVQIIKSLESEEPQALYYHNGKGSTIEVEKIAGRYCFTNYVGNDISFYDDIDNSSDGIDYIVENLDGTKYSFGSDGEIRIIEDRYGNEITFQYTYKEFYGLGNMPIISKIIDTVGREISFTYDEEDEDYEYIYITVTSPYEEDEELMLSYKKEMVNFIRTNTRESISTEPVLIQFTNTLGEKTSYLPSDNDYSHPVQFTFADKFFDSYISNEIGCQTGCTYLLGEILKMDLHTYYSYSSYPGNLGRNGVSDYYKVIQRGNYELVLNSDNTLSREKEKNVIEYEYGIDDEVINDYTGYPYYSSIDDIDEEDAVCRTKEISNDLIRRNRYYKYDGAVVKHEETVEYKTPVGNALVKEYIYSDFFNKQPVKTQITYKNNDSDNYSYTSYIRNEYSSSTNKAYGKPTLISMEVDSDTYDAVEIQNYSTKYTYYPANGYIKSKSWFIDDNIQCLERYSYHDNMRISEITHPDDTKTTYDYEYNADNKVTKKTINSDNGKTITEEIYTEDTGYAYPTSIVKKVIDGENVVSETTSYTYNMLLGVVTSVTDNDGNVTYYEYDKLGRPTRIIYPKYATYSNYNTKGYEIMPIETIEYSYVKCQYEPLTDDSNRVISNYVVKDLIYYKVTDMDISVPTEEELANVKYGYKKIDSNCYLGTGELIKNWVWEDIDNDNIKELIETRYYYDNENNTKTITDADGNETKIYYDGLGREVKTVDMFNNQHITEYNIAGDGVGFNALSYFVPNDNPSAKESIIEYDYDRNGRVESEKAYEEYPDEFIETKYEYDIAGNVKKVIDPKGNETTLIYDVLNRPENTYNANGEKLSYQYDDWGNITKQTVSHRQNTDTLYNRTYAGEGKLISDTDDAQNSNIYSYDDMGRVKEINDKNNNTVNITYNALGDVEKRRDKKPYNSFSDKIYTYTTPHGANRIYEGKYTYNEDTDSYKGIISEKTETEYSTYGKIQSQLIKYNPTDINGLPFKQELSYKYDVLGNVLSVNDEYTYNEDVAMDKTSTFYEYDKNRLSKVQLDGENERNSSDTVNAQYEYYPDGKLKSISYPPFTDGTVLKSEYTYDGLSRLETLTNYKGSTVLSGYSYTYDDNGNILTVNETIGENQENVNYTYDKLNRITSVSGSKGADSYYEYDYRGNRKTNFEEKDSISEKNTEYRYNEEYKLKYSIVENEETWYDYSSNGYRYLKTQKDGNFEYYIYNPSGNLQANVEFLVTTDDKGDEVITLTSDKRYIWGAGKVLAQLDNLSGKSYYYIYNGHGDVVQITDTDGNIVNQYDYDVWGNFLKKQETIDNHFTYFGQTYDEETGLYYLRARYYDPTTGRFTQQDPAEDGYNWYVYGNQNPVMFVDPSGLFAKGDQYLTPEHVGQIFLYTMMYYAGVEIGDSYMSEKAANDAQWLRNIDSKESYHFGLGTLYEQSSNSQWTTIDAAFIIGLNRIQNDSSFFENDIFSSSLSNILGTLPGALVENILGNLGGAESPSQEYYNFWSRLQDFKTYRDIDGGYIDVSVIITGSGSYINLQYTDYYNNVYLSEDFFENTYYLTIINAIPL